MKTFIFALFVVFSSFTYAEVPPLVDENEPQITIYHGEDKTFYEYRINGQLKEIKVVPNQGKEYYLVPAPGEGNYIRHEESQLLIPSWVIFRW